ncbi:zinc finger protein RFP-like isoform X2 [Pelodiscus sinensis]|uniref:zinc finger protein RFP-like isoform X2 n=1 Tax=Pelodiscus sinensis TaxID=13735 RepID=UPI003F6C85D4
MAAENPARTLQEEATCSICLDYFHEPVMIIDCGHNFCRACITQCQEGWQTNLSCPCCRGSFPQRNLKPNRQLASLAEVAKQLNPQLIKDPGGERVCEKHQEALKLFCQDDQTPICVVCNCSKEHRAHSVVPSEEAAQEYKVEIQSQVEILKKERAEIQVFQSSGEMASQELLQEVEAEKQKVVSEFEQLHLFLEKQEEHRLGQLRELDQEIKKRRDENATKFSTVLSCLGDLVCELEGKCQQPVSEFLQDIRSTLNRCRMNFTMCTEPCAPPCAAAAVGALLIIWVAFEFPLYCCPSTLLTGNVAHDAGQLMSAGFVQGQKFYLDAVHSVCFPSSTNKSIVVCVWGVCVCVFLSDQMTANTQFQGRLNIHMDFGVLCIICPLNRQPCTN